jgi:hypothetical protein
VAASSTREEYIQAIEKLKAEGPPRDPPDPAVKRSKLELGHLHLVQELETRLEAIDAELAVRIFRHSCMGAHSPAANPAGEEEG